MGKDIAHEGGASSSSPGLSGRTEVLSFEVSPAALERYEEPVFRVLPAGFIQPANPVALEFAGRMTPEDMARLQAVADKSASAHRALVDMVDVGGEGKQQNLQVSLIPLRENGGTLLFIRDLTLDNSLRLALVDSRRRYKDFIEISTDFPWETGADERFAFVPPRGALGYTADGLMAMEPRQLLVADAPGTDVPFLTKRRIENEELWLRRPDGRAACVIVSAMPLIARDGKWLGARGVCRDVTETRDREATLTRVRNRERVLTRIVRAFRDEVNPEAMLVVAAEALARGLGAEHCHIFRPLAEDAPTYPGSSGYQLAARYGDLEPREATPVLKTIGEGAAAVEILLGGMQVLAAPARYQNASNGAVILWRSVERGTWNDDDRLLIGDIANQVGITIEQFTHHEHVLKISRTDGLTGLLNRGAFVDGLHRFLVRLLREGGHGVLMYVDLDNFKAVNDTKGHQAGDDALLKVRDILVQHTRPTDLIARLGGDEFALWLHGADLSIAKTRAGQFLERMVDLGPYSAGPTRPLGMSIGIAVWDRESKESLDSLLARGDAAMYQVKRDGKGTFAIADAAVVTP